MEQTKRIALKEGIRGIEIQKLKSGPLGGDQQLGALIAEGEVDMRDERTLVDYSSLYTASTQVKPTSIRSALRVGTAIVVLSVFVIGSATSPLPAPEHRYAIDGTLIRIGGDPAGYAVVLMGRFPGDTALHILRAESTSETDLSISGSGGNYFLQVSTPQKADSLAVVAFRSDRVSGISAVYGVDSSQAVELWETVRVSGESSGCGDCATNSKLSDRLVAFRYSYSNVSVSLP